jgi:phthiodiolone/phenolphthiodiolone dimycocerosates ketoreductase
MKMSHLTKRAPILGVGTGERMNPDSNGLDFTAPVTRPEEALHVIGLRLSARGLMTFSGKRFGFDGAITWQRLR